MNLPDPSKTFLDDLNNKIIKNHFCGTEKEKE